VLREEGKRKKILQMSNHRSPDSRPQFFQHLTSLYLSSPCKIAIIIFSPSWMTTYYPVAILALSRAKGEKFRLSLHTHIHTHQESILGNYEDAMGSESIEEYILKKEEQKQEKDKGSRGKGYE